MKDKNLILLVDDDRDVLKSTKIFLEDNGFQVETALNGKFALKRLENLSIVPDLIVSDISMSEMSGYELLRRISNNHLLNQIPFIFLSGLSTAEDIRLGKLLGVDDYITKPFEPEDLLSTIEGKLKRYKISNKINYRLKEFLKLGKIKLSPSISKDEEEHIYLFLMSWNKITGPSLYDYYPKRKIGNRDLNSLGDQFFQAFKSIYGMKELEQSQDVLVNLENLNRKGYFYFFYQDHQKSTLYLMGLISPNINYLHSLKIKKIFEDLTSDTIIGKKEILEKQYPKIVNVLSESPL